ncbi:MAG: YdcF family protein [Bacteroidia bacterium]
MRIQLKKKKILKIIFGILSIPFLYYTYTLLQLHLYSSEFHTTHSDVAIILGAGSGNGKISAVFQERCNHAIHLYKKNHVKKILVTGGYGEGEKISDSQVGKNYLIKSGIPSEDIFIEEQSRNTIENLFFAKEIMQENDLSTALIISDPPHMKRSMKIAEILAIEGKPSPTPSTMYRSNNTKWRFYLSEAYFYIQLLIIDRYTFKQDLGNKKKK